MYLRLRCVTPSLPLSTACFRLNRDKRVQTAITSSHRMHITSMAQASLRAMIGLEGAVQSGTNRSFLAFLSREVSLHACALVRILVAQKIYHDDHQKKVCSSCHDEWYYENVAQSTAPRSFKPPATIILLHKSAELPQVQRECTEATWMRVHNALNVHDNKGISRDAHVCLEGTPTQNGQRCNPIPYVAWDALLLV